MFKFHKSDAVFILTVFFLTVCGMKYDGIISLSFRAGPVAFHGTNKWYVFKRDNFLYRWTRFKTAIIPWPIYYVNDSRDCDHYRVVSACRARNGWQYLKACDSIYEGAEGPEHIWRVTKAEYESHKETRRDYMAEAFEDGHPYSPDY